MNEFLRLDSCGFLCKCLIKGNVAIDEGNDRNEI